MKEKGYKNNAFIVLIITFAIIISILLALMLRHFINKAIYNERKEALVELVSTASQAVSNHVEKGWEIAKVYENDCLSHIGSYATVEEYLAYLKTQMPSEKDSYFLVDSTGKYYAIDGKNGKLVDTENYLDSTGEKVQYIGTLPHLDSESSYLIFRTRLNKTIQVKTANGNVEIKYCALMQNIEDLVRHIDSLFDSNNNTIIFNTTTGVMLYKKFGLGLLIEGYNVYDKYKKVNLLYGEDTEEVTEEIKNGNASVTMMKLSGEKYYLCSTPLDVSNWSLLLVVEGEYFNSSTSKTFTRIIILIGFVLLVVSLLIIALIWYFNKLKINKQLLENEVKANEVLNEAYNVKSNFLSYMSHDIRTPINGMIGMAKIGIDHSSDKEKVEECFKKIDLSSKHLLAIVNDVLDMSVIESGKLVLQNEKMNVVYTLDECIDIIKGTMENRNLDIVEVVTVKDDIVMGDEFHLKQIIINILSNAVKFTEDGGTIRVSLTELVDNSEKIKYEFKISDTGIGMTEEFKNHVFEAFKVANLDGKTKYKGSGLGMAITKEYVNLMNGEIEVESKLNEGSTFIVTLPFIRVKEQIDYHSLKNLNVLLVEDNDINLEIEKDMLEKYVKNIHVAKDGKQALDAFLESKEFEYDLILMDIMMPIMNGFDSAKAIRSSERRDNNVVIIALTANNFKDDVDSIKEARINSYLNKPFNVNQLIEKIKQGFYK